MFRNENAVYSVKAPGRQWKGPGPPDLDQSWLPACMDPFQTSTRTYIVDARRQYRTADTNLNLIACILATP